MAVRSRGYVPAAGDLVLPLICVQRAEMFATITGLSISPSRAWLPQYFENGLLLFASDFQARPRWGGGHDITEALS